MASTHGRQPMSFRGRFESRLCWLYSHDSGGHLMSIAICRVALMFLILGADSTGNEASAAQGDKAPEGWTAGASRDEIRPTLTYNAKGGRDGKGAFVILQDEREGLHGYWQKTFPVKGGEYVHFQAWRKINDSVLVPRQSASVRILWRDAQGKNVPQDEPAAAGYLIGWSPTSEAEHPTDKQTDNHGWTEVSETYRVPSKATQAIVSLNGQWAPNGIIEWSQISFESVPQPKSRLVRLASVHHRPTGKSAEENCREFAPFIEQAAAQKVDLIVLGETITVVNTNKSFVETAEPVPGPSTDYFGQLAKRHDMYIVVPILERDKHLVYNVTVLMGPDGKIVGKYRKTCLPRGEIERGISPGHEYPVFETRFGKVGMMICYDGFFPEVARELTNKGAEVIAWPVWGCNPMLAKARACENQVYIVSSTYEDIKRNWALTAVYDHSGEPIVHAKDWDTIIVSEVDLNKRLKWNSLGDFKGELPRHRPVVK